MKMQWTIAAVIAAAGIPAASEAQQRPTTPDSAKQGTATGRRVNQTNEGGDTTRSALRDSLLRNSTRTAGTAIAPSTDAGAAGAAGGMGGGAANLSRAQTRQLQTALNGAGCSVGRVDGRMGRRTREAMACARQKNNITGNDDQALFKALGLSF